MNNEQNMMNKFGEEVLHGLQQTPKSLPSKYFYDARGDKLFQDIMAMEEYYLTNVEFSIFENKKAEILEAFWAKKRVFGWWS